MTSHAALVRYLYKVSRDYNSTGHKEWENHEIDTYLHTLARYAEALPNLYANRGEELPDPPTWAMIATLINGASGYE